MCVCVSLITQVSYLNNASYISKHGREYFSDVMIVGCIYRYEITIPYLNSLCVCLSLCDCYVTIYCLISELYSMFTLVNCNSIFDNYTSKHCVCNTIICLVLTTCLWHIFVLSSFLLLSRSFRLQLHWRRDLLDKVQYMCTCIPISTRMYQVHV